MTRRLDLFGSYRPRRRRDLRERAVNLPYAHRRVLFAELARSLVWSNDRDEDGRQPTPFDMAERLIANIRTIVREGLTAERGAAAPGGVRGRST